MIFFRDAGAVPGNGSQTFSQAAEQAERGIETKKDML